MTELNTQPIGRVLVIDDEDPTRYIFRKILTRAGFLVDEASTGHDGLVASLTLPDVIILDVNLPDMIGYEVARRLKANPLTSAIPILQVSASFVSDESKVQAFEGGADSYLIQPVEPTVLIAQVKALQRMRRAESLSHLSALHWQTTFNSLSDGLALISADGTLIRANSTFMRFLHLVAGEVEGTALSEVFDSRFGTPLEEFLANQGRGLNPELAYADRFFRVRYDLIDSGPGESTGAILVVTDVTDHKKLEETLKLSERLAATGRLAHVIAHEINNPLEAMANLLYLASQPETDSGSAKGYLDQATEELMRISRITKQVLAFHRNTTAPSPLHPGELVESVLALFRTALSGQNIELDLQVRCDDPIRGFPGELRQVFTNLVSNAIDAMAGDGGVLIVRCMRSVSYVDGGLRGLRFVFSDNGSGIPEEIIPRIHDAFFTTKQSKGSGIGLWLSSEVIGKHRGRLRLRSRTSGPYRGTLFDVFLPLD